MTTHNDDGGSLRDQLRGAAGKSWGPSDEADVMARAMFSLHFAERWLAEQVDLSMAEMRGEDGHIRRRFASTGRTVDLVIETGVELRLTGAVEPPADGWALVRLGDHRQLLRLDEDGMFTAALPDEEGTVDLVLEFDDGATMTMKDVAG